MIAPAIDPASERRGATANELLTVEERLGCAYSCLGRIKRLGRLLDGNVAMMLRCASGAARRRLERRAEELSEAVGILSAEIHGHLDAIQPHIDNVRVLTRIDQRLADLYRDLVAAGRLEEADQLMEAAA